MTESISNSLKFYHKPNRKYSTEVNKEIYTPYIWVAKIGILVKSSFKMVNLVQTCPSLKPKFAEMLNISWKIVLSHSFVSCKISKT